LNKCRQSEAYDSNTAWAPGPITTGLPVPDMDTYRTVAFLLYLFPGASWGPESNDGIGPFRNRHPKILAGLTKARSIRMANKTEKSGPKRSTLRSRPNISACFPISAGAAS
jgi:hypothetical protein